MRRLPAFPFFETRHLRRSSGSRCAPAARLAFPGRAAYQGIRPRCCTRQPPPACSTTFPAIRCRSARPAGFMTARDGLRLRFARFARDRPAAQGHRHHPARPQRVHREIFRDDPRLQRPRPRLGDRRLARPGRFGPHAARPGARLYRQFLRLCPRPRAVLRGGRAARLPRRRSTCSATRPARWWRCSPRPP